MKTEKTDIREVSLEDVVSAIEKELDEAGGRKYAPKDFAISGYAGDQHIKFTLSDVIMAIPLSDVHEIGRHPRITPLPNLPPWILGVSNIRGEIISMVDIRAFFHMQSSVPARNSRFIILHNPDMKVGIIVEKIMGIFSPDSLKTGKEPFYRDRERNDFKWAAYISRVLAGDDELIHILDIHKLLSSPEMNAFGSD